jgi:predicted metalloendopeptidase
MSLNGRKLPVIDGLTRGDQRFFLAWAQCVRCAPSVKRARASACGPTRTARPTARVNEVVRNQDGMVQGVQCSDRAISSTCLPETARSHLVNPFATAEIRKRALT